ncbi:hypothetical protein [Epibacterium ulvae]|uniref:hypothetical protein n=1 Tax=Epibacterium ulvae TaxID=1156985 RepID=UPI00248FE849|nr:hypothetical protein [Epibacterium ulvae]
MTRTSFLLPIFGVALGVLSACATPLERCIKTANSETATLNRLISETEKNLARGYAIHKTTVPYTYSGVCHNPTIGSYSCPQTGYRTQETPVAIDVPLEKNKLSTLRAKLAPAQKTARQAEQQCHIAHPVT